MGRVLTNNVSLASAIESTTVGVLPASPVWRVIEPNTIGGFGASLTTVARRPISKDRALRKGTVTNLESSAEFEADMGMDLLAQFLEGFLFSEFANVEFELRSGGATPVPPPTVDGGGGNDTFTVDSVSALLAGKMVYAAAGAITLVFAKGYTNAANNGLKPIAATVSASDTAVEVATGTLVAETPNLNASLSVAGVRTDDVTLTISGSTATLVSAADVDWTLLGIQPGQYIHIGSDDGTGAVQNAYDDAGTDDVFGYARVTIVSATTLTLDKLDVNIGSAGPHTPETIDIMFGRFCRNVAVTADSDDQRFIERTYQIEAGYPDLGGPGVDEYEYAIGNFANELVLTLPLADKATLGFNFIGTNADDITPTRKTNAGTAIDPLRTTAVNTSSDIAALSTDLISSASDVCFKSLGITFSNNVSPEQCLGTLGATFVNAGVFEVALEAQMLFTNKAIINAIKNNTTVTLSSIMKNDDGAVAVDLPSMTVGGGDREYPQDESVLVNLTGSVFNDTTLGHALGVSLFPSVPTVRP